MPDRMVRRSSRIVAYWREDKLTVENYVAASRVTVHPTLLQILSHVEEPTSLRNLLSSLSSLPDAPSLVDLLCVHNLLIEVGSALDHKERQLESWNWGREAEFFHFATKEVNYTFDFDAIRVHFEAKSRETPPPPHFKTMDGPSTQLPKPRSLTGAIGDVLIDRRTCRDFCRTAITLQQLADIAFWTWGKQRQFDGSKLDQRILKTSPSGGARHPIEVYAFVQRVEGVGRGVYHYSVENHRLVDISKSLPEIELVKLFSGQEWVADSSVAFVMTAILPRVMWKYDHSRAYRVIQLDAGHLGQTFHLVSTAIGLGPFTTAALQDELIEDTLGIDGVEEIVVYGGAVGIPKLQ